MWRYQVSLKGVNQIANLTANKPETGDLTADRYNWHWTDISEKGLVQFQQILYLVRFKM